MSYKYHVFLSYRRYELWPDWVNNIFLPIFKHWLGEEMGEDVDIFIDVQIETGVPWPEKLGAALAGSQVLVPLLSRQYFNSNWCKTELASMDARQAVCGFSGGQCHQGLIVPAIIHDGKDFPESVKKIQGAKLQEVTNVRMVNDGITAEKLSEKIRAWVPDVVKAINRAPEYDPAWQKIAIDEFIQQYNGIPPSMQTTVPHFGLI